MGILEKPRKTLVFQGFSLIFGPLRTLGASKSWKFGKKRLREAKKVVKGAQRGLKFAKQGAPEAPKGPPTPYPPLLTSKPGLAGERKAQVDEQLLHSRYFFVCST